MISTRSHQQAQQAACKPLLFGCARFLQHVCWVHHVSWLHHVTAAGIERSHAISVSCKARDASKRDVLLARAQQQLHPDMPFSCLLLGVRTVKFWRQASASKSRQALPGHLETAPSGGNTAETSSHDAIWHASQTAQLLTWHEQHALQRAKGSAAVFQTRHSHLKQVLGPHMA